MRHLAAMTVLAMGLLLNLIVVAPARSQAPGDTLFEGTHDAGGTIRFTVSPGGQIAALELEGIAGGGCSWGTIDLANWGGPIQTVDGAFEATNADGDVIRGQLVAPSAAEGTVEVADPAKGCRTPPLRWVATAPAAPSQ
jgi:hypothetical protein